MLDKPSGLSSNHALQRVRRLFNAKKAGHTGNLDPLATGVLPICLGEATKVSAFLLDANKGYRAECRLGQRRDTADAEGEIIETAAIPRLSKRKIEKALQKFTGRIEQVPPMYSALKHNGQPLYKLARKGETVDRKPRQVLIHDLCLVNYTDDNIVLDISCSKGTYIRTLAEDIGAALGTCAYVANLRRTLAAPFEENQLTDFEQLQSRSDQGVQCLDELLLPVDAALPDWPFVELTFEQANHIQSGQAVLVPYSPGAGLMKMYRVDLKSRKFLGIGKVLDDGRVGPKRLIFTEN